MNDRSSEEMAMSEREILYRLIGEVGELKSSVAHQADAQQVQWGKIDTMGKTLVEMNGKLDDVMRLKETVVDNAKGVKQYRNDRTNLFAWVAGVSIGASVLSDKVSAVFSKWFGGGS